MLMQHMPLRTGSCTRQDKDIESDHYPIVTLNHTDDPLFTEQSAFNFNCELMPLK